MNYQLAQLNIAKFKLPMEHPDNADFVNNLDRVNAIAESQPGFIWRPVAIPSTRSWIAAHSAVAGISDAD